LIHTAVIPAGGYGSRMEPITKAVPKPMLPIIRKPAIHFVVEEATASGLDHIVIVAGYKSAVIKDYFCSEQEFDSRSYGPKDYFEGTDIEFVVQDQPRGLADAVLCAKDSVSDKSFAVLLSDDIIRSKEPAISHLCSCADGRNIIGCQRVELDKVSNYGVLITSDDRNPFSVSKVVEKPKTLVSDLAIAGRYVFNPSVFDALECAYADNGIKANLTDAINIMITSGEEIFGFRMDGKRYDIGNEEGYIETLNAAITERW